MALISRSMLEQLAETGVQRYPPRYDARTGRPVDARHVWEEQVKQRPDSFDAHVELGKLYAEAGERQSALREYHAARRLARQSFSISNTLRSAGARAGAGSALRSNVVRAFERHREEAFARVAELRRLIAG